MRADTAVAAKIAKMIATRAKAAASRYLPDVRAASPHVLPSEAAALTPVDVLIRFADVTLLNAFRAPPATIKTKRGAPARAVAMPATATGTGTEAAPGPESQLLAAQTAPLEDLSSNKDDINNNNNNNSNNNSNTPVLKAAATPDAGANARALTSASSDNHIMLPPMTPSTPSSTTTPPATTPTTTATSMTPTSSETSADRIQSLSPSEFEALLYQAVLASNASALRSLLLARGTYPDPPYMGDSEQSSQAANESESNQIQAASPDQSQASPSTSTSGNNTGHTTSRRYLDMTATPLALYLAIRRGDEGCVRAFISAGVDLSLFTRTNGFTVVHAAMDAIATAVTTETPRFTLNYATNATSTSTSSSSSSSSGSGSGSSNSVGISRVSAWVSASDATSAPLTYLSGPLDSRDSSNKRESDELAFEDEENDFLPQNHLEGLGSHSNMPGFDDVAGAMHLSTSLDAAVSNRPLRTTLDDAPTDGNNNSASDSLSRTAASSSSSAAAASLNSSSASASSSASVSPAVSLFYRSSLPLSERVLLLNTSYAPRLSLLRLLVFSSSLSPWAMSQPASAGGKAPLHVAVGYGLICAAQVLLSRPKQPVGSSSSTSFSSAGSAGGTGGSSITIGNINAVNNYNNAIAAGGSHDIGSTRYISASSAASAPSKDTKSAIVDAEGDELDTDYDDDEFDSDGNKSPTAAESTDTGAGSHRNISAALPSGKPARYGSTGSSGTPSYSSHSSPGAGPSSYDTRKTRVIRPAVDALCSTRGFTPLAYVAANDVVVYLPSTTLSDAQTCNNSAKSTAHSAADGAGAVANAAAGESTSFFGPNVAHTDLSLAYALCAELATADPTGSGSISSKAHTAELLSRARALSASRAKPPAVTHRDHTLAVLTRVLLQAGADPDARAHGPAGYVKTKWSLWGQKSSRGLTYPEIAECKEVLRIDTNTNSSNIATKGASTDSSSGAVSVEQQQQQQQQQEHSALLLKHDTLAQFLSVYTASAALKHAERMAIHARLTTACAATYQSMIASHSPVHIMDHEASLNKLRQFEQTAAETDRTSRAERLRLETKLAVLKERLAALEQKLELEPDARTSEVEQTGNITHNDHRNKSNTSSADVLGATVSASASASGAPTKKNGAETDMASEPETSMTTSDSATHRGADDSLLSVDCAPLIHSPAAALAAAHGHMVSAFYGNDILATTAGLSVLMLAAYGNNTVTGKILLAHGVDANAAVFAQAVPAIYSDADSSSPLDGHVSTSSDQRTRTLLVPGRPRMPKDTALLIAVAKKHRAFIAMLLPRSLQAFTQQQLVGANSTGTLALLPRPALAASAPTMAELRSLSKGVLTLPDDSRTSGTASASGARGVFAPPYPEALLLGPLVAPATTAASSPSSKETYIDVSSPNDAAHTSPVGSDEWAFTPLVPLRGLYSTHSGDHSSVDGSVFASGSNQSPFSTQSQFTSIRVVPPVLAHQDGQHGVDVSKTGRGESLANDSEFNRVDMTDGSSYSLYSTKSAGSSSSASNSLTTTPSDQSFFTQNSTYTALLASLESRDHPPPADKAAAAAPASAAAGAAAAHSAAAAIMARSREAAVLRQAKAALLSLALPQPQSQSDPAVTGAGSDWVAYTPQSQCDPNVVYAAPLPRYTRDPIGSTSINSDSSVIESSSDYSLSLSLVAAESASNLAAPNASRLFKPSHSGEDRSALSAQHKQHAFALASSLATALQVAAELGDVLTVTLLLRAGAVPQPNPALSTPSDYYKLQVHHSVITALIASTSDDTEQLSVDLSKLNLSAPHSESLSLLESYAKTLVARPLLTLVQLAANSNASGDTQRAQSSPALELGQCRFTFFDSQGRSPLVWAVIKNRADLARLLLLAEAAAVRRAFYAQTSGTTVNHASTTDAVPRSSESTSKRMTHAEAVEAMRGAATIAAAVALVRSAQSPLVSRALASGAGAGALSAGTNSASDQRADGATILCLSALMDSQNSYSDVGTALTLEKLKRTYIRLVAQDFYRKFSSSSDGWLVNKACFRGATPLDYALLMGTYTNRSNASTIDALLRACGGAHSSTPAQLVLLAQSQSPSQLPS